MAGKSRIRNPKLCKKMREKIARLPDVLPPHELRREQAYLWAYPDLLEAEIMEGATERDLSCDDKNKLFDIHEKRRAARRELRGTLLRDIGEGYRVSVFRPDGDEALLERVKSVGTCWSSGSSYEENCKALNEDLKTGGSVVIFCEKKEGGRYKPKVFSRSSICTAIGGPLLFVDTIENGSLGTNALRDWSRRREEFLMITTGWMYIARKLGMGELGLGEIELYELGQRLGAQNDILP